MGFWQRLLGKAPERATAPLYAAVVSRARDPEWYLAGAVPDTIEGRFDMVATVLSFVLLRLEAAADGAAPAAELAECFVEDMDGQLREIGIGDVVVGKHLGRMMGMLGGRLGAYREGLAAGDIGPALVRNLYRGEAPGDAALTFTVGRMSAFSTALQAVPLDALLAGRLP